MQGTNTRYSAVADPLGRLARYAIGSSTTRPVFDGWNTVQERAQNGSVRANLLTGLGLDQVFLRTTSSQRELLSDALGSTVAEADTTGVVATSYTYEPYGRTSVSGAGGGLYQFTGRENHSNGALALYNLRNRYYSPTFGRFLTQDPVGFAGGDANPYGYLRAAPTRGIDPIGLRLLVDDDLGSAHANSSRKDDGLIFAPCGGTDLSFDPRTRLLTGTLGSPCLIVGFAPGPQTTQGQSLICLASLEGAELSCTSVSTLASGSGDELQDFINRRFGGPPEDISNFGGLPSDFCARHRALCAAAAITAIGIIVTLVGCSATGCDPQDVELPETQGSGG